MAPKKGQKQRQETTKTKTEAEFGEWYGDVVVKGGLCDYYPVKGCLIYRPAAMAIWDSIKDWFDARIKADGVKPCYFPLFVPKSLLSKEEAHLEGFAAEVCWVTPAKDPNASKEAQEEAANLEPIAVRPTSECVMYTSYAKWIRSHRDLPLRLNQWCNVVRWETTHTMPFIRGREFLWQEGHSAYATKEEAVKEVYLILDWYAAVYEELLAVPVRKGVKTEKEKFAGADFTTTVEAYVPVTGRSIQGGTSHHLGQHFSKMFDIKFSDADGNNDNFVYQNSWGLSTRSIGVAVMVHSDDTGLVMPPRVAPDQVVVIPVGITAKLSPEGKAELMEAVRAIFDRLKAAGIRAILDDRDNVTPGNKFNEYELLGLPMRLEVGPKDLEKECAMSKCRYAGAQKVELPLDGLEKAVADQLDNMHNHLYQVALEQRTAHTAVVTEWEKFTPALNAHNVILAPTCNTEAEEDIIKNRSAEESVKAKAVQLSGAKSLCIPQDHDQTLDENTKCILCGEPAKAWILWGRAY